MKKLFFLFFASTIFACTSSDNKGIDNTYAFSITKLIDTQLSNLKGDSACKTLMNNDKIIEITKVDIESIKKDLLELKDYDINKLAYKNSFDENNSDSLTTYTNKDQSNHIKFIKIYGDITHPIRVEITIENNNNLYTSTKHIDWHINQFIRVINNQKVKAMQADNIDIISYFNGNCDSASATLSVGK
jgi:hypothetical protein